MLDFMLDWPCILDKQTKARPTRFNKWWFIGNQLFLNMFLASLRPSSGEHTACHCLWFSVLVVDVVPESRVTRCVLCAEDVACRTTSSAQSTHIATRLSETTRIIAKVFYILLTVHHAMILGKWPTWCTKSFYVFIFIYNSLHVSSTSWSSSGETNCINTASGNSHSILVAEMCAGWKKTLLPTCTHLGLCHWQIPMTLSGIEPATCRFVA
jgi:hypothetical protein